MRDIHSDDIRGCAEQGASTGDGSHGDFFLVLEVIGPIRSLHDAAFDFPTLVVKLGLLLPHAEVYHEQLMHFRLEVERISCALLRAEIGDLNSWSRGGTRFECFELNGDLHIDSIVHTDNQVGELPVARRKLAYFSEGRCFRSVHWNEDKGW